MPFLLNALGVEPRHNYTAVIYVQIGAALGPNAALYKLVRTITKSQFVDRVSSPTKRVKPKTIGSSCLVPNVSIYILSPSLFHSHFRYSCCGLPIVRCR